LHACSGVVMCVLPTSVVVVNMHLVYCGSIGQTLQRENHQHYDENKARDLKVQNVVRPPDLGNVHVRLQT